MDYLTLDRIEAYTHAYALGNEIWEIVSSWQKFERWSIGIQVTRSADSMSANIAEGYGRFHKKEKIHFYRYSAGSVMETKDWLLKAKDRGLITPEKADHLIEEIEKLPKLINRLIQYTNQKLKY
ncbi:MAG: four helix bundle protein [Saprospiraceae bacterium]|nr:four helix bundle protein [Lewinella sp.]